MRVLIGLLALFAAGYPAVAQPPSVMGVDAPQLAAMGPNAVGFRSITLVHRAQPMLEASDPKASVALNDRKLVVDIWYPATTARGARPVTYRGTLFGEPPRPPMQSLCSP